jgi:hypothetical protein
MVSSLPYFSLEYRLDATSRPWKQLVSTSRDIPVFRPLIEVIVGGDVAICNTACHAHDNWSRGPWKSQEQMPAIRLEWTADEQGPQSI